MPEPTGARPGERGVAPVLALLRPRDEVVEPEYAPGERGVALVLALLLLLALSGIGAVVLLSVASDNAAARNEAWAEAATAQAEAGLELGKAILAAHVLRDNSFESALPPARRSVGARKGAPRRSALPADSIACQDPERPGCRDYELFRDETIAGANARIHVGRVLRDVDGRALLFDPRAPRAGFAPDLDGDGAPDLAGVTVWIRRPVLGSADAGAPHDRAILTAEARHPPPAAPDEPHAVSRLELTLRLAPRPGRRAGEGGDYDDGLTGWAKGAGSGALRRLTPSSPGGAPR